MKDKVIMTRRRSDGGRRSVLGMTNYPPLHVAKDVGRAAGMLADVQLMTDETQTRQTLEAVEFALKVALREVQWSLGYAKTTDTEHTCRGLADDYRVHRSEDGDWLAEIVPDDWLMVTHCPWCGMYLEKTPE